MEPGIRVLITSLVQKLDEHKDGGWFFDVGANVGLYVWEVAKVCPTRKILAFEPDPANFELLEMTRKEADFQNFELCPDALSNQTDEVSFSQDPLTSATGCIRGEETALDRAISEWFHKPNYSKYEDDGFRGVR